MCAEITYGLIVSCPCNFMCTGVIVITATIAACETAIDGQRQPRPRRRSDHARGMTDRRARCRPGGHAPPPATTSGSGRSRTAVLIIASKKHMAPNSHGPVYRSRPNHASPARSVGR